jgi:DNA-binding response OmpR family regulator
VKGGEPSPSTYERLLRPRTARGAVPQAGSARRVNAVADEHVPNQQSDAPQLRCIFVERRRFCRNASTDGGYGYNESTMTLPASLLIVDDDRELGQMLTEYLTGEGFQVSLVRDGAEALDRLTEQSHPFDLVILDVMLPSLSGFEVLRRLRHTLSVPVIMLTAHGADVDRIVGLELGADDYLSKPFNPRELVARIRAVLRRFSSRDTDTPSHPVSVGPLRLDPATFEVTLSGQAVRLTGTELRLLEVLMRSVGQVQSRESLTERVLGRRLTPYDRSIDTHVSNLRRKLGLGENGLPEIRSIRGAGYVLIATGEARV